MTRDTRASKKYLRIKEANLAVRVAGWRLISAIGACRHNGSNGFGRTRAEWFNAKGGKSSLVLTSYVYPVIPDDLRSFAKNRNCALADVGME